MAIYIFGVFDNGFTQCPNDSTSDVFKKIYSSSKAQTQIVIHRDGNLMYYCYIRKLDKKRYVGFCVVLTGQYLTKIDSLFSLFENVVERMANKGSVIHYTENGELTTTIDYLFQNNEEIALITQTIANSFDSLSTITQLLPPTDFSVAEGSTVSFSVNDSNSEIVKASYTFTNTYIYKDKDYNTIQMNRYIGVLSRVSKERDELKSKCLSLTSQLTKAKAQQRNIKWVSILGAIVLVLGVVIWNKVLYPSEVTHYETGEFVYYGPLKNNKPHGTGVAIYPADDEDGRKYYIGNFVDGERQDTAAILFYQDGDYYYGSMDGDKWERGILYMNSDNSHFVGTYNDNEPYNGEWFDHKMLYKLVDGQKVYGNRKMKH